MKNKERIRWHPCFCRFLFHLGIHSFIHSLGSRCSIGPDFSSIFSTSSPSLFSFYCAPFISSLLSTVLLLLFSSFSIVPFYIFFSFFLIFFLLNFFFFSLLFLLCPFYLFSSFLSFFFSFFLIFFLRSRRTHRCCSPGTAPGAAARAGPQPRWRTAHYQTARRPPPALEYSVGPGAPGAAAPCRQRRQCVGC